MIGTFIPKRSHMRLRPILSLLLNLLIPIIPELDQVAIDLGGVRMSMLLLTKGVIAIGSIYGSVQSLGARCVSAATGTGPNT
jgi:hypothetical protein